MTRYYLTLKPLANVADAYRLTSDTFLGLTGNNVGNLVFRKGLASLVDGLSTFKRITFADLKDNPSIYDDAEIVVVSCANWLGMREQIEASNRMRADRLMQFNCPVVAFGLGIQAFEGQEICLGPNTLALAETLASKNCLISVRDGLTATVLKNHGIKTTLVTGCPSNFIDLQLSMDALAVAIQSHASSSQWKDVSCLLSEATMGHPLSHAFIAASFDILAKSPSKYALQVGALLKYLKREANEIPTYYLTNSGMGEIETKAMIRDKAVCFSGVDEWMFAARNFDLAFGMRMHGTMVALQAGVPSVLITHDRRTYELAKTMDIPRISLPKFVAQVGQGPGFLYDCALRGLPGYFHRREKLAARMANYLNQSGLQPSTAFSDYLDSPQKASLRLSRSTAQPQ